MTAARVLRDDAHTFTLSLTFAEAQTLVDVAHFGVAGPAGSRADLIRSAAAKLLTTGLTHNRQDFAGLLTFDPPGELPGLNDPKENR